MNYKVIDREKYYRKGVLFYTSACRDVEEAKKTREYGPEMEITFFVRL